MTVLLFENDINIGLFTQQLESICLNLMCKFVFFSTLLTELTVIARVIGLAVTNNIVIYRYISLILIVASLRPGVV